MKYRMLHSEELEHLEEDLKAFLIVNGVQGDEWKLINEQTPEKAVELVALFSDNVLQKVYERISFLEFRSPDSCMVFQLEQTTQKLIVIQRKTDSTIDLSSVDSIHVALTQHFNQLEFFRSEKAYSTEREIEIHQLIEQGCVISTPEFFQSLEQILN